MMRPVHRISDTISQTVVKYLEERHSVVNATNLSLQRGAQLSLRGGLYLDEKIIREINSLIETAQTCEVQVNNVNIVFKYWDRNGDRKCAKFYMNFVCLVSFILDAIYPQQRTIHINLIDYERLKKMPEEGHVFTSFNVNSGVTMMYSENVADVLVYRREEMGKVLIHELIHAFNIDSKPRVQDNETALRERFCLDGFTNVNEAFTDSLACLLNVILYTIFESKSLDGFAKRLDVNLTKEVRFMTGQARRILEHSKFDKMCSTRIREETHAISYFVIKALLFSNLPKFSHFLVKHNLMLKSTEELVNLVVSIFDKVDWQEYGKEEYREIQKKNTLRMSSIDIVELMSKNKSI